MYDVFISYSSRGSTEPDWILKFRDHLKKNYLSNYGRPLSVWDMSENGPGTDFVSVIDTVLNQTLVLIIVLDPLYPNSPQTLDEIRKYVEKRKNAGEPAIIIKVIKKNGGESNELRKLVNSNILASSFSKSDANDIEVEFQPDSPEYQYEIARITKELRKYTVENRNKKNAAAIKKSLDEAPAVEKIYVAFGDYQLEKTRANFINQLGDTLRHHSNTALQNTKLLPDDFTIPGLDFFYEDIGQLLCVQNASLDKCMDDLLNASGTVIIPLEADNLSDGENMLKRMVLQIDAIMKKAKNEKLLVYIFLNIPDTLYDLSYFKETLLNPAYSFYKNIRVFIKPDITSFINEVTIPLNQKHPPPPLPDGKDIMNTVEKNIYFIEYNKGDEGVPPEQIQKERQNIDETVGFISEDFVVLTNTYIEPDANLGNALDMVKDYLSISKGIVIYRGIRGELPWYIQQQSITYKILQGLHKDSMQRAVFVDPLQTYKQKGAYIRFNYKALLNNDPELKQFSELKDFLYSCKSQ